MLEPMVIVSLGEVRPVMGSAAFLPGEGADHYSLCNIKERLELEGLHKLRIKYTPFILHRDGSRAMGQCRERHKRRRHGFVGPDKAKIEAHQLTKFFTNLPRSDRSFLCQQPLNSTLFGRELVCDEGSWRDRSDIFSCSNSSTPAEYNRFKQ